MEFEAYWNSDPCHPSLTCMGFGVSKAEIFRQGKASKTDKEPVTRNKNEKKACESKTKDKTKPNQKTWFDVGLSS